MLKIKVVPRETGVEVSAQRSIGKSGKKTDQLVVVQDGDWTQLTLRLEELGLPKDRGISSQE